MTELKLRAIQGLKRIAELLEAGVFRCDWAAINQAEKDVDAAMGELADRLADAESDEDDDLVAAIEAARQEIIEEDDRLGVGYHLYRYRIVVESQGLVYAALHGAEKGRL